MDIKLSGNISKIPHPKIGMERLAGLAVWLVFLALLAWDAVVIKQSLSMILKSNSQNIVEIAKRAPGVRIDFEAYKKVVDKIEGANSYQHNNTPVANPFWSPVVRTQAQ